MTVRLTPDVQWISECLDTGGRHVHASVYLIEADDGFVLVDSGSFHDRAEIKSAIEQATDGEGIDVLILSHADYPHSANATAFLAEWDDVQLVASTGRPELQGLTDATKCPIGGTMELMARTIEFVDPPLADRQHTVWIYDLPSQVLFTADAFGDYHDDTECESTSSGVDGGISLSDVRAFHRETLPWLRYVDPERLRPPLERLLDERDVKHVAPIHGNPIVEQDLQEYVGTLVRAIAEISAEYEPPEKRNTGDGPPA